MATFAEYNQQTMASNSDDFTLYPYQPYQDVWNPDHTYLPSTTLAEQAFMNPTTFDSFQAQQAFAQSAQDQYTFHAEPYQQMKNSLQPPSSNHSPASYSFDFQQPPNPPSISDSGASVQSTISSTMGSPSIQPQQNNDWAQQQGMGMLPNIVHHDSLAQDMFTTGFDLESIPVTDKGCVDPSLIQPFSPTQFTGTQFPEAPAVPSPRLNAYQSAPSPDQPRNFIQSPRTSTGKAPGSASPYVGNQRWQPYPAYGGSRRQSVSSNHSRHSQGSISSDDSNKGLCPIPTCGRHVKDLKAHMLTHQNERPEKCPIPTCEYHTKGFARKYDKNRHTLTHYKGTMVCGFCPGSGSNAEKSFNRADVFKRHLTSVHGVEQTPPNARRKSPATASSKKAYTGREVSGMCSTCSITFASAQDFYEHLDDCVLRVVQQADPSEAINEKLLSSVAEDKVVQETMEKNMLPTIVDLNGPTSFDEEEEADEEEDAEEDDTNDGTYGSRSAKSGKGAIRSRKVAGTSS